MLKGESEENILEYLQPRGVIAIKGFKVRKIKKTTKISH